MTFHQQADTGGGAVHASSVLTDGARIVVPDTHLLLNGSFHKHGSDLVIEKDGQRTLIEDYFASDRPQTLHLPDGGLLDGDTVHALAGVGSPWVVAQAGGGIGGAPQIGSVQTLVGGATVQRAGAATSLAAGQPIFQGDVVETAAGASLGIVLRDNTVFSLSGGSRMVMTSLVYDAGRTDNSMSLSLVQGAFTFVTGQVAKTGAVSINTPVSTMGIRGTTPIVRLSASDGSGEFSLAADPPEAGGAIGSYTLTSPTGSYAPVTVATTDIVIRIQTGAGPVQQSLKTPTELQGDALLAGALYQLYQLLGPQQPTDPRAPGQRGDLGSGGQTIVDVQGIGTEAFTALLSDLLANTALNDPNGIVLDIFGQEYRLLAPALSGSLRAAVDLDVLTPGPNFLNTFVEDGTGSFVTGATLITAPGGATISSVTVVLQGPTTTRLDNLLIGNFTPDPLNPSPQSGFLPNGVAFTVVFGSVDVILTPGTSAGTISDFQAAVQAIRFINTSENPDTTPRTVDVTVTLSDGSQATAQTTIQVIPVNDPPVAEPLAVTVSEDGSASGQLIATDVDSTGLKFAAVTEPAHGALSIDPDTGQFIYTPAANFNGADSFTFAASDGIANSAPQTVTISVGASNDDPVADDEAASTNEDTPLTVGGSADPRNLLVGDLDIDGDALTVTRFTVAGLYEEGDEGLAVFTAGSTVDIDDVGALTINADGSYAFEPDEHFNGPVPVATYTVSDGNGGTDTGTLTLTVNPENDDPEADDEAASTNEDTPLVVGGSADPRNLLVGDLDIDGDGLAIVSFEVVHNEELQSGLAGETISLYGVGALTINANGSYSFAPAANFYGAVPPVTYTVSDGSLPNTGTLTLTVNPVNDAPAGTDKTITSNEDALYTVTRADFGFSDLLDTPANGFLGVKITTLPGTGSLTLNAAAVTAGQLIAIGEIDAGLLQWRPVTDANGLNNASFTFQVQDDGGIALGGVDLDQSANTITVNVTPVNDAPVADDEAASTNEDTTLTVGGSADPRNLLVGDIDVDGDTLTVTEFAVEIYPGGGPFTFAAGTTAFIAGIGALTIHANGSYSFAPAANFYGAVPPVTYTVSDGNGGIDTGTLTLTVNPVNDAPVNYVPGAQTVDEGDDLLLYNNDDGDDNSIQVADIDATTLKVTLTVAHGTLTLSEVDGLMFSVGDGLHDATMTFSGSKATINAILHDGVTYRSDADYTGADTLTVTTSDLGATGTPGALTDTDTVQITVTGNDAPILDLNGASSSAVGWTSNTPEETTAAGILDPTRVSSAEDYAIGSGLTVETGLTQLEISGFNQSSIDDAADDSDYLEYVFTTAGTLSPDAVLTAIRIGQPEYSDPYQFGVLISNDGFESDTFELIRDVQAGSDGTPGELGAGDHLIDTTDYVLAANSSYTVRAYFYSYYTYDEPSFDAHLWDDFRLDITDSSANAGGLFIADVPSPDRVAVSIAKGTPFDFASDLPTITDPDSANFSGAQIQITNLHAGDELIVDGSDPLPDGITASYSALTGLMTLAGVASLYDYVAALEQISFRNLGATVGGETRLINVTVFDETGDASNVATSSIAIQAGNNLMAANDLGTAFSDAHEGVMVSAPATGNVLENDTGATAVTYVVDALGNQVVAGTASAAQGLYGTLQFGADGTYTYIPHDQANRSGSIFDSTGPSLALSDRADATRATWERWDNNAAMYDAPPHVEVFTYQVSDAGGNVATSTLTIEVGPSLDSIAANDDAAMLPSTRALAVTGNLIANDTLIEPFGSSPYIARVSRPEGGGDVLFDQTGANSALGITPIAEIVGQYGTLRVLRSSTSNTPAGDYEYVLDQSNPLVAGLAPGATLTESFDYTVWYDRGQDTATITFTIQGSAAGADVAYLIEGTSLPTPPASGDVLLNDAGLTTVTLVSSDFGTVAAGTPLAGQWGILDLEADGTYVYSIFSEAALDFLLPGELVSDVFTYTADAGDLPSQTTLEIIIQGADDPLHATPQFWQPVFSGALPAVVKETPFSPGVLIHAGDDPDGFGEFVVNGSFADANPSPDDHDGNPSTLFVNDIDVDVAGPSGNYRIHITRNSDETLSVTRIEVLSGSPLAFGEVLTVPVHFKMAATDNPSLEVSTTVTFQIIGNTPPVGVNDAVTLVEAGAAGPGTPIASGFLLANDTDANGSGDPRSLVSVNSQLVPSGGIVIPIYSSGVGTANLHVQADGGFLVVMDNGSLNFLGQGQTAITTVPYTIVDSQGATSTANLVVTVNGANDAPQVFDDVMHVGALDAGIPLGPPDLDGAPLGISINDSDPDRFDGIQRLDITNPDTSNTLLNVGTSLQSLVGLYGTLSIARTGNYTYTIDGSNPDVAGLALDASLTEHFEYTRYDGSLVTDTAGFDIVIHGQVHTLTVANDAGMAQEAGGLNNLAGGADAVGNVIDNDLGNGLRVVGVFTDSDIGDSDLHDIYLTYIDGTNVGTALNLRTGTIMIDAEGDYRYVADQDHYYVESLGAGDILYEDYVYYLVEDAYGQRSVGLIDISIDGAEDIPRTHPATYAVENEGIAHPFFDEVTGIRLRSFERAVDNENDAVTVVPGSIEVTVGDFFSAAGTILPPGFAIASTYNTIADRLHIDQQQFEFLQKYFAGTDTYGDESGTPDVLTINIEYSVQDNDGQNTNRITLNIQGDADYFGLGSAVDLIDFNEPNFAYNRTIGFDDDAPLDSTYAVDILSNFDNAANRLDVSELLRPGFGGISSGNWYNFISATYDSGTGAVNVRVDPDGDPYGLFEEFQIARVTGTDTASGQGSIGSLDSGDTISVILDQTQPAYQVTIT